MSALGMGQPGGFPPSIQIGGGGPADSGAPQKSDGDWEQDLQSAIAALRELEGDAQDHQEASVIATCIANLRKLTAQRQAGAESAMGISPAHKALKRAY
jgi:hypothetical protein